MSERLRPLPRAQSLAVVVKLLLPLAARGLILRRPRAMALLERVDADAHAIELLDSLRQIHGPGPLRLRLPGRELAVVLSCGDAQRVLNGSPEESVIANREKRAALERFQPHGVLISDPGERPARRAFNEQILETGCPRHSLAESFAPKIEQQTTAMLDAAATEHGHLLDWDTFATHWWQLVRRLVLGDQARHDEQLNRRLTKLRAAGAAIATFRALALMHASRVTGDGGRGQSAAATSLFLESLRLWPTTPAILRDTTADTQWQHGSTPSGTTVLIYTPFLHRDPQELGDPDRFHPELWEPSGPHPSWVLAFSAGPGACPGRDLVTRIATSVLGCLESATASDSATTGLRADRPLPATLSPFQLRFEVDR